MAFQYSDCKINHSTKSDKVIQCSSPFCNKEFHMQCAGLKSKKQSDLNNIYFLCRSCNDFIAYSNNPVQNKLAELEIQLKMLHLVES